ncbi:M56 family metallopeptidase [Massilia norwichensis]|uniref:M56 family metallopeptidase n=1 Tax=Massilia norwichensis TaxID=1442366 RepID=A0ABT2A9T7_9BURK|nr:M56 family metallopeptidase [Massilia norwichensis]MCS0590946.1 M56 family metallopeptidase [Massilia norwichensis]
MSAALVSALLLRLGIASLVFTLLAGSLILVRRPLRRRIGAAAVYALWLALPIGLALCCWPRHQVAQPAVLALAPAPLDGVALPALPVEAANLNLGYLVAVLWLAGAVAAGCLLLLRQRAFLLALGPLRPGRQGAWLSMRPDAGPMLVGLLRPRIVLPADFLLRYDAAEQAAVLAHEALHARRGDLWWNALAALIGCLFWFHPLAGAARRRFLADQELACDSAVLGSGQHAPRAYANALLKSLTTASLPVGCTMQAISPTKERIMHLQDSVSPRRARIAIAVLLAGFSVAGAGLGWAASGEALPLAAPGGQYRLATDLSIDGGAPSHDEVLTAGSHRLAGLRDGEGRDCEAELTLAEGKDATVAVQIKLVCDGKLASNPRMVARFGEPMTLAIGRNEKQADGSYVTAKGFRLSMRVDKA